MKNNDIQNWRYVTLKRINNSLEITLTDEGKEEIQDIKDKELSIQDGLEILFEDMICNGWTWVLPEEVGALTDSPLICDDFEYLYESNSDEYNDPELEDKKIFYEVYYFPDYQILSELDQLEKGKLTFELSDSWKDYSILVFDRKDKSICDTTYLSNKNDSITLAKKRLSNSGEDDYYVEVVENDETLTGSPVVIWNSDCPFKKDDLVYITTNSVGKIIDLGCDKRGEYWFRTDAEGIRYKSELRLFKESDLEITDVFIPNGFLDNINKEDEKEKHYCKMCHEEIENINEYGVNHITDEFDDTEYICEECYCNNACSYCGELKDTSEFNDNGECLDCVNQHKIDETAKKIHNELINKIKFSILPKISATSLEYKYNNLGHYHYLLDNRIEIILWVSFCRVIISFDKFLCSETLESFNTELSTSEQMDNKDVTIEKWLQSENAINSIVNWYNKNIDKREQLIIEDLIKEKSRTAANWLNGIFPEVVVIEIVGEKVDNNLAVIKINDTTFAFPDCDNNYNYNMK